VPHLGLAGALIILATSGVFTGYLSAPAGYIFDVIPDERRGQVGGVVGAGMSLGQGTGVVVAGLACAVATPSDVIAVCGAAGTVIAVRLAVRWRAVTRGGNPT
jgi:MFS family permease